MVLEIALGVILGVIGLYLLAFLIGLAIEAFGAFLDDPKRFLKWSFVAAMCIIAIVGVAIAMVSWL